MPLTILEKTIINNFMSDQSIQENKGNPVKKSKNFSSSTEIIAHFFQTFTYPEQKKEQVKKISQTHVLQAPLKIPPKERTPKQLKKIRSQLTELTYFKKPPIKETNPEFFEIFKRDNTIIIELMAPFAELRYSKKGKIIEATGMKRNYIRFLLNGEIFLFEPINQKVMKNCQIKIKDHQYKIQLIENEELLMREAQSNSKYTRSTEISENRRNANQTFLTQGDGDQGDDDDNYTKGKAGKEKKEQIYNNGSENLSMENEAQIMKEIKQTLTKQQCKVMLQKCGILSPLTPHHTSAPKVSGQLLSSSEQPLFIDQKSQYFSTTICSTDCIFLQINFQLCEQIIQLVNNDRERPYILSLLFKFPMLKYIEAKNYVTQEYMLSQEQEQEDQDGNRVVRKSRPIQFIKQLKVINSFNFELSYTGNLYIIISGSVRLFIDMISERKPSNIQYIVSIKRTFPKEILKLSKYDIFGFQEIGKSKSANLRYVVENQSNILKINQDILNSHKITVHGFAEALRNMKRVRNKIIEDIIEKMDASLEQQEIIRHEHITYTKSMDVSPLCRKGQKQVKQLRYLGVQKYQSLKSKIEKHFSPENTERPKQFLSPEIINEAGLGVEFSQNLMKKKDEKIEIKDGWIETRDKKGSLLRRKKIRSYENGQSKDQLLNKLGILNSQEIASHNHEIVRKRQSKYQFQDLYKQGKQFKRIREKALSLPKLTKFFSKKEDRMFTVLYKKKL